MIDELERDYMDVHVAYPTVLTFSYCMPIIQLKLIFFLYLQELETSWISGEPTIHKSINSGTRWQMHIIIGTEICATFED
jgi:hypothetical protein